MRNDIKSLLNAQKYEDAVLKCKELLAEDPDNPDLWYSLFLSENGNYINTDFNNLNNELAFNKAIDKVKTSEKWKYISEYNLYREFEQLKELSILFRYNQMNDFENLFKHIKNVSKDTCVFSNVDLKSFYDGLDYITSVDYSEKTFNINIFLVNLLYLKTGHDMAYQLTNELITKGNNKGIVLLFRRVEKDFDELLLKASMFNNMNTSINQNITPVLTVADFKIRIEELLESSNYVAARSLINEFINIDYENPLSYLYLLLMDLKVSKIDQLTEVDVDYSNNPNYLLTIKYADNSLKQKLESSLSIVISKLQQKEQEELAKLDEEKELKEIALSTESNQMIYEMALRKIEEKKYSDAINLFDTIIEYLDSKELKNKCVLLKEEYALQVLEEKKKNKKKLIKAIKILTPILVVVVTFVILLFELIIPTIKYNEAIENIESGNFESGLSIFDEIKGFKDIDQQIKLIDAEKKLIDKDYQSAINILHELDGTINVTYNTLGGAADINSEVLESEINNNCVRNGYTFLGWGLEDFDIVNKDHVLNLSLIALYEEINYSISYDINGGIFETKNPTTYQITSDTFVLNNPTKVGYTFIGWTGTSILSTTKNVEVSKGSYGNLEFTANFKANEYIITYNVNGGETLEEQKVTYDETYELLTPTRAGYTFVEWQYEGSKFENGTWNKTNSITLEAVWSANEYTITYDVNGGDELVNNTQQVIFDEEVDYVIPTKTGYDFGGWAYNSNFVGDIWNIPLDVELIAVWSSSKYEITYDVNTGDSLDNNKQIVYYDINVDLIQPTKTGYTFMGWYNESNLIQNGIWKIASNVELVAKWEANDYTITYDVNGGETLENQKVTYDETYELLTPTQEGYTFVEWKYEGSKFENGTWNKTNSITLEAVWSANTYTITYDVNGGDELVNNTQQVVFDEEIDYVIPTKTGYTFMGWYNELNLVQNKTWKIASNVELVAKWEANEYTITYDVNGGETLEEQKVTYDEAYELLTPTKVGYTFVEWQYEGSKFENGIWKIASNVELVANFKANEYIITYNVNGGETLEEQKVTYDETYELLTPTKAGYTFVEWQYEGSKFENGIWNKTNSITLEAVWSANEYTIYYYFGTQLIEKESVKYDSDYIIKGQNIDDYYVENWMFNGELYENGNIITYDLLGDIEFVANDYISCGSDYTLLINGDDTATITKYTGFEDSIIIPDRIRKNNKNYIINKLEGTFNNNETIENVVIPNGIEDIGPSTFYNCKVLTTVSISSSVTTIGKSAFGGCEQLEKLTIPNSVNSIGNFAFSDSGLSAIELPGSIKTIAAYSFSNCSNLKEVILCEGITDIETYAFSNCEKLKTVVLPESLVNIGQYAFEYCEVLEEVNFNNNLKFIGQYAFRDCKGLINIVIPSSLTVLEGGCFSRCSNLLSVFIPSSVEIIGSHCFEYCEKLKIYCEVAEKPDGWHSYWSFNSGTVTWNYNLN